MEDDGPAAGRDAVRELVRRGFDASAILCLNDISAMGVLRELRNRNIRVPEDVSVTGFDNINLSEFACPSVTTVQIPCNSVAHMMFKMLTDKQSGERNSTEYVIDTEVVIRESSGPFQGGSLPPRHVK
jgi:DNA-binding LacI/PurR family transcriptional regulator